jgi:hypothetical protein
MRARRWRVAALVAAAALAGALLTGGPSPARGQTPTFQQQLAELEANFVTPVCVEAEDPAPAELPGDPGDDPFQFFLVDQSHDRQQDFSPVVDNATDAGYAAVEDVRATKQEILDHLALLDSEDIWVYFGHASQINGVTVGLTGIGPAAEIQHMTLEEIVAALTVDGDAPGVVYVGGCKGTDILQSFVDSSTKVAVAWDRNITLAAGVDGLKAFWADLLALRTFGQARQSAHAAYRAVLLQGKQEIQALADKAKTDDERFVAALLLLDINNQLANPAQLVFLPEDVSNRTIAAGFPVGGVGEPVTPSSEAQARAAGGSGPSAGAVAAIAGGAAAVVAAGVAGGWYARRRRVR